MNPVLLVLASLLSAEPPMFHETVFLHKPLLPNTVTQLSAAKEFIYSAELLAKEAGRHQTSQNAAKIVHANYRAAVFGEHIVIAPDREFESLPLGFPQGRENINVVSIVIAFRRPADSVECEFTGLFAADVEGQIHEFADIPAKPKREFEKYLTVGSSGASRPLKRQGRANSTITKDER